ncbi:MAG TPA: RluA family pseudouridine synthase [Paludibacteraceae bacterium]|nr:RluA family pseudouridine synthase [Paludibacteraceae bacterium]HOU67316.1 RluA family pseudouridine synthase [Paludibacteraceae bacterium]HQF49420.1 RluA family pseudouridine synthase [Paludibacteraceae bacterium]HQJ90251.1 RluA family pseudouridine synthase [Paludibacteraceae bacterium]
MIDEEDILNDEDMDDDQGEPAISGDGQFHEHFRFTVEKGHSLLRIDKYLVNCMSQISRNRIQEAADANCILVNGKAVKSNYRVKPLDLIQIMLSYPPSDFQIVPQDIPLDIVYEDKDVILVNKRPGMVVHPGFGNFQGTLLNALAWYLKDSPDFNVDDPRLGLVHRIDKDTSGLLVIAKNEDAKTNLGKQFFNKTTQRCYNALVWGNVEEDEGTIRGDIGRDPRDRMLFTVFLEGENPNAKHAVTHYKVLERFGYVTLVECRLETGRTHQIRVHMKHIGHTLFNDDRYGGHEILRGTTFTKYKQFVNNCFEICPRQALHAKTLGFVHPRTNETMYFNSELPEDMAQLIERWRTYAQSNGLV